MTVLARCLLLLGCIALLGGCATQLPEGHSTDARDPFEAYNRSVFEFNSRLDSALVKPVAEAYQSGVPRPVRKGVSNFFGNFGDLVSVFHHLLQAEPDQAGRSAGRVFVNSTVGILGIFDPASDLGLQKRGREDFGQTLGRWGAEPGPYIVLPLMGPSTGRDALGTALDIALDPIGRTIPMDENWRIATWSLRLVDTRAGVLELEEMINKVSFDRYLTIREGYLARRQQQVRDRPEPSQLP